MDASEAERLARIFVGTEAGLTPCAGPPEGLYCARPSDDFFFFVGRPRQWRVGGVEVIVVDCDSGEVRHAGFVGE